VREDPIAFSSFPQRRPRLLHPGEKIRKAPFQIFSHDRRVNNKYSSWLVLGAFRKTRVLRIASDQIIQCMKGTRTCHANAPEAEAIILVFKLRLHIYLCRVSENLEYVG
jgi:hypothetical protein